jgi:glutamyl-tRNA synthetase
VSLGGPIFDIEKLNWLNGLWIRESLSDEVLAERLSEWCLNRQNLMRVLPHIKSRMETLSDFIPKTLFLTSGQLNINEENFKKLNLVKEKQIHILQFSLWELENLHEWNREELFSITSTLSKMLDIKLKEFLTPLFIAITGTTSSFSLMDAMELLGPDMTRARIRYAINCLGGVSKKNLKALEKSYRNLKGTQTK